MLNGLNTFQIVVGGVVAAFVLLLVLGSIRNLISKRDGVIWSFVGLATLIAILQPGITTKAASALGIGRGADLVFYVAILLMFLGFWMTYMRLRHLRKEMTSLVRHIAILQAEEGVGKGQNVETSNRQNVEN